MTPLLTIDDVAHVLQCDLPDSVDRTTPITGASIDSRTIDAGNIFFALPGSNTSGVEFLDEAFAREAIAAVVPSDTPLLKHDCVLQVEDVPAAMSQLAALVRDRSDASWIAVTGSVGKTTTRHLLAAVLNEVAPTHQSPHNYNNALGVPLTMLGVMREHEFVVIEVGTSAPGEVATLGKLVRPHTAIITAVAEAHLDGLSTIDDVAREKLSLAECLEANGWFLVTQSIADNWPADLEAVTSQLRVAVIATAAGCEIDAQGTTVFWSNAESTVPLFSRSLTQLLPLVRNANEFITDLDESLFQRGLNNIKPLPGRCEPKTIAGRTIIDDTYNANPASMRSGLDLLTHWPTEGRRFAVLGTMLGLGHEADRLHSELVASIPAKVDDVLFFQDTQKHWPASSQCFDSINAIADRLTKITAPDDVILVKGSRATRMERVIESLREQLDESEDSPHDQI